MNRISNDIIGDLLSNPEDFDISEDPVLRRAATSRGVKEERVCVVFKRKSVEGIGAKHMDLGPAAKLADEIRETSTKASRRDLADRIYGCVEKGKRHAKDTGLIWTD